MRKVTGVVWTTLIAALLAPATPVIADDAAVVRAEGAVTIVRDGTTTSATVGDWLRASDTIRTGSAGFAQLHLRDDSTIAIPPASEFRIVEFQLPARSGAKNGIAVFESIRGGFRTITGRIGKGKDDRYEARTPVATITVRGSAYRSVLCAQRCSADFGLSQGAYVKADGGVIVVSNAHGSITLRAGEVAYVQSDAHAPVKVKASPWDDPDFSADYEIDHDFKIEIHPPRIEPDPSVSPSQPPAE